MKKRVISKSAALTFALVLLTAGIIIAFTANDAIAQVRPALVKDVENPAHATFTGEGSIDFAPLVNARFVNVGTVPIGKRLVIEHVAINCYCDTDDEFSSTYITIYKGTSSSYNTSYIPIFTRLQGITNDGHATWVASESLRLYSDGVNDATLIYAHRRRMSSWAHCQVYMSGYTVDMP